MSLTGEETEEIVDLEEQETGWLKAIDRLDVEHKNFLKNIDLEQDKDHLIDMIVKHEKVISAKRKVFELMLENVEREKSEIALQNVKRENFENALENVKRGKLECAIKMRVHVMNMAQAVESDMHHEYSVDQGIVLDDCDAYVHRPELEVSIEMFYGRDRIIPVIMVYIDEINEYCMVYTDPHEGQMYVVNEAMVDSYFHETAQVAYNRISHEMHRNVDGYYYSSEYQKTLEEIREIYRQQSTIDKFLIEEYSKFIDTDSIVLTEKSSWYYDDFFGYEAWEGDLTTRSLRDEIKESLKKNYSPPVEYSDGPFDYLGRPIRFPTVKDEIKEIFSLNSQPVTNEPASVNYSSLISDDNLYIVQKGEEYDYLPCLLTPASYLSEERRKERNILFNSGSHDGDNCEVSLKWENWNKHDNLAISILSARTGDEYNSSIGYIRKQFSDEGLNYIDLVNDFCFEEVEENPDGTLNIRHSNYVVHDGKAYTLRQGLEAVCIDQILYLRRRSLVLVEQDKDLEKIQEENRHKKHMISVEERKKKHIDHHKERLAVLYSDLSNNGFFGGLRKSYAQARIDIYLRDIEILESQEFGRYDTSKVKFPAS